MARERIGIAAVFLASSLAMSGCGSSQRTFETVDCQKGPVKLDKEITLSPDEEVYIGEHGIIGRGRGAFEVSAEPVIIESEQQEPENVPKSKPTIEADNSVSYLRGSVIYNIKGSPSRQGLTTLTIKEECVDSAIPTSVPHPSK